ncbi:MAG: hypothetical protein LBN43_07650 [Oscillospiraceae bacterium]|jgi:hypothetical protein|nr:hypothetical protein [Oscillospiraceae bacterium]
MYKEQFEAWYGSSTNGYFVIGMPVEALLSIGVPSQRIIINKSKIVSVMNEHNLSSDIMLKLPEVVNNPVMILESRTQKDSFVLYGELYDELGRAIMVSLRTNLYESSLRELFNKITSVYVKDNTQRFISNSKLIYTDKKRITVWLQNLGLQLPSGETIK